MSKSKPNSEEEIFVVMKDYSTKKEYSFTDIQLRFMAENCFLHFESRGWTGIKYWPAVAMKWCLNNLDKQPKVSYKSKQPKGKSIKKIIMEQEND